MGINIKELEELAGNGDVGAIFELGKAYFEGNGVESNFEKARGYFEVAAERGSQISNYYLGKMYYNGNGVATNHLKAKEYFEKSASADNVFSTYYLGKLYYWGDGVEKDYDKANLYKSKVLSKPFFSNQDTDIKNFYSFTDFEGASRTYATNLQKRVQNEFANLFGNEDKNV